MRGRTLRPGRRLTCVANYQRNQLSRANSSMSYKVGNWHASPPLRRGSAATGPSFLAAATTSGWPDYRLHDSWGLFGYWSELVFPSSRSTRPKRAPHQGTPRCEPPPKERVVKYWNKLPASVVTAPSVTVFKRRLEKVWAKVFLQFPQWLNTLFSISLPPPHPTCTPPISSSLLYMLPSSLFYILMCGFRPVVD